MKAGSRNLCRRVRETDDVPGVLETLLVPYVNFLKKRNYKCDRLMKGKGRDTNVVFSGY